MKSIVEAVSLGGTYRGAAIAAGVSEDTFRTWRGQYPEFFEAIARAESELRMTHLQRIEEASRAGSWQASIALLELRFPHDFGKRTADRRRIGWPDRNRQSQDRRYPFLANPAVREAACAFIDALAEHDAREALEVAETIAEDARIDRRRSRS